MTRSFTHRIATRDKTPLLVGLVGPSSSGKTFSALRLATGFQRVNPGEIFVIDTESGRALQYADDFKFAHVPFGAPFGPLDYLDVIKHCIDHGATNIVIDSMSHEHEGPGGVLEMHAVEHQRLGGKDSTQGFAWAKPKSEHRRLINTILQFNCNFIFCFRAKEKLDWNKRGPDGKKLGPQPMGFMAIGGGEWMYEMTAQCLLLPSSSGIPTWKSEQAGEKETIKLPKQFISTFAGSPQLSEDVGEAMAKWSAGAKPMAKMTAAELIAEFAAVSESSELRRLAEVSRVSWPTLSKEDKPKVKAASDLAAKRIEDAAKTPEPHPVASNDDYEEPNAAAAG
jgi:hypothetical protein